MTHQQPEKQLAANQLAQRLITPNNNQQPHEFIDNKPEIFTPLKTQRKIKTKYAKYANMQKTGAQHFQ